MFLTEIKFPHLRSVVIYYMSELRLKVMEEDCSSTWSCGVHSIDELIRGSYAKTIFKQALAYNIVVDGYTVGNCMIKFVRLLDEDADYYEQDQEFIVLEISYLAIDQRLQKHGLGTQALKILITNAKKIADFLPVRFLVIDAFKDKEDWYYRSGFRVYPKVEDLRYPDTVPMRMDLINRSLAEKYSGSF